MTLESKREKKITKKNITKQWFSTLKQLSVVTSNYS